MSLRTNLIAGLGATVMTAAFASSAFAQCSNSSVSSSSDCSNNSSTVALAAFKEHASSDIVDTAIEAGSFNTLLAACEAAGLVEALRGEGPFTVFAPSDDAFGKISESTIHALLQPENRETLAAILTYHVVPGRLTAREVTNSSGATSLNGQRVDFASDNGVMIDGAKVVAADIECSNGIIHVIDTVIMPTGDNIVGVAQSAGMFNTLLAAATAAGLAEPLMGEGPFTVFAPTDDAFAALPHGTVERLLRPENRDQLAAILKYHVVSGRIFSGDAASAGSAETLLGQNVWFSFRDGRLTVNGANIIATDIDASNGVVHVIDAVILPAAH